MNIVLLHGLGRGPADWDGVRGGLARLGDVVTPSLPREPVRALAVAAAAVTPGSVVIGHSMGGVLALRLAGRGARAIVLTGCSSPARNGRSLGASLRDYGAHRLAFLRSMQRRRGSESSARALLSLVGLAARPGGFGARVEVPVLVVHAVDDHHVPVDFAVAAARSRGWELRVLPAGGHHVHLTEPGAWLECVVPWLAALAPGSP